MGEGGGGGVGWIVQEQMRMKRINPRMRATAGFQLNWFQRVVLTVFFARMAAFPIIFRVIPREVVPAPKSVRTLRSLTTVRCEQPCGGW